MLVGEGALDFWSALEQVYPETAHRRCWFHKLGNILAALPKSLQGKAKADLQAIWMAETRAAALGAFKRFVARYQAKYPKATEKLMQDREALLADTGYHSQENLERCAAADIEPYIPEARQRHNPPLAERLSADPPVPTGELTPIESNRHRLHTRTGKAHCAKRKSTVETAVFGIIKHGQGFCQFLLRGLHALQGEWALVCLGWSLKRLLRLKDRKRGQDRAIS